jgi:hypothetical protein
MACVAWLVGEVTFALVHNTLPGLSSFVVLIFVYYAVKITGDVLCLIVGRAKGEWGYFDDYLLNELAIGWPVRKIRSSSRAARSPVAAMST